MNEKTLKKYRLLPLIPFGVCSRQSLYLATKIPEMSYMIYSADITMAEREKIFHNACAVTTKSIDRMLSTGYIEEKIRRYGNSKAETIRTISLTKAGLYLLCGYPDDNVEWERQRALGNVSDTQLHAATYRSLSLYDDSLRNMIRLTQVENNLTEAECAEIKTAFYDALQSGELSILTCASAVAPNVNINNPRYNGRRVYRNWRLSNITALFLANNYLTYIDRRPMNKNWAIGSIHDEDSFNQYLASGEMDIPAFIYHALNKWYQHHPNSFRFMDPLPSEAEQIAAADTWRTTPAFYSTMEIPGFYAYEEDSEQPLTKGQRNNIFHTLAGIAVGKKLVYIVHHTKPTKTPWGERWELTSINVVQDALENAGIFSPSGEPYRIEEAIVVCGSIGQFVNYFNAARANISRRWKKENKVGAPYKSVCLVPLNGSGAMQIRYLMLLSPPEMDFVIMNNLLKADTRFTRTNDGLFPLTFDGTPVFIAHSMQLQNLYDAILHYEEGMKFYVSCYPGQAKYIRRLMPDVEFL